MSTLKALTVLQPWASAIALGQKRIETRSRPISYRGPLLIHAGKGLRGQAFDDEIMRPHFRPVLKSFSGNRLAAAAHIPKGAIVAVAQLIGCRRAEDFAVGKTERFPRAWTTDLLFECTAQELALGDFSPGRFGWVLADVKPLPRPIPCSGKQGLWNADPQAIPGLADALKELGF